MKATIVPAELANTGPIRDSYYATTLKTWRENFCARLPVPA